MRFTMMGYVPKIPEEEELPFVEPACIILKKNKGGDR